MDRKQKLKLELAEASGTSNIYFQPPENAKMKYPCVVCNFESIYTEKADNRSYIKSNRYDVTYISRRESEDIANRIVDSFMNINMNRAYTAENLYHYNFTLYY